MKRPGLARRMLGADRSRPLCPPTADRRLPALLPLLVLLLGTLAAPRSVHAEEVPRFTQEPQSAIVAHHQSVTLHCQVEPSTAQTGWLFNGEPLDPDSHWRLQTQGSSLYFPRFSRGSQGSGNYGEYRCTATTSAGTVISRPAVLSKPVLRQFPTSDDIVITAHTGGYATIPCSAPYSHPPATIHVQTSSGRLLSDAKGKVHRLPSGSVVLTDLDPSDSGNYTCVAVNPVSGHNRSASQVVSLTVTPHPQDAGIQIVDQSMATLKATSGDSVLLECPVAGLGAPSVVWKKGYGSLPEGHSISQFGNLQISSVALRDSGTYICETYSGQKHQVLLEVQMPPAVVSDPADGMVTAEAGDTVRLTCRGGAFPAPSVTWYHNGRMRGRPSMNSAGEVHSIMLQQVTSVDEGIYVCELSNRLGQASAVLQLVVHPSRGEMDTNTALPDDTSVVNGAPEEIIPVDDDDDDGVDNNRNFHLKTQNHNKHRNGRKRKKNGKKKNKKNRRRKNGKKGRAKKVKLVPPSAPSISRESDTAVMVHWSVPENDGLPISLFRVQYKEVKSKNGQWQTVDEDISAKARSYRVSRLKAGRRYKFRIAAVYSNNDNRNSNYTRFHLKVNPYSEPHPPKVKPKIVEALPIIYQTIHAIGIKWQYHPVESNPISGFYIYHKPYESKEDFERQVLEGQNIRSHLLTDLKPDTEYSIKMRCFNSAGDSEDSNVVVKRTLPEEGRTPGHLLTPMPAPDDKQKEMPPTSRREAGGLDQPVILGIVLGIMLLLLVVFITMCWWKQRQQKRRSQSPESCSKFQDQAHRIYTDSLRKKHPNGGPYPLTGMNGLALANGHGPPHGHQPRMNIDMNPLSDVDHMHHHSQLPTQRDLYSGKPYPHGNGMIPNGTLPGYGHGHNSDNNFNNIRHTVSSDNVLSSSGMVANGINSMGSLQRGGNGGGYSSRPYSPPAHSKTSLSSFSPGSQQHHREGSLSHSDDPDSPDEMEPLARENPQYARDVPPAFRSLQGKGPVRNSRDNVNRPYDRRPCYMYDGTYDCMPGSGYREEGSGFHHWSAGTAPSPSSSSHTSKHKRRRKRPHSEREHTMKDQATNTDLSSNEGTIEFGMLNKSPSSSVSNGSDNSMSGQLADGKTVTANGPHSGGMPTTTPSVTAVPVGSL